MSELEIADREEAGRPDAVVVSVAPPEGPVLVSSLRGRGYEVFEVGLEQLGMWAIGRAPRVMIVDVDQPGAAAAIERTRELAATAELLCIGDAARAAGVGVMRADGRAFERPVDLDAVVMAVVALAEPALPRQPTGVSHETTPPPGRRDSEMPGSEGSDFPSTSDPLDIGTILPSVDDLGASLKLASGEVSPELSQLLQAAEQRLLAAGPPHPSSIPSPDDEPDLLLPPELLSALDEPLDPEDEGPGTGGTGAALGTAMPRPATTGAHKTGLSNALTGLGPAPGTQPGDTNAGTGISRVGPPTPPPPALGMEPPAAPREPSRAPAGEPHVIFHPETEPPVAGLRPSWNVRAKALDREGQGLGALSIASEPQRGEGAMNDEAVRTSRTNLDELRAAVPPRSGVTIEEPPKPPPRPAPPPAEPILPAVLREGDAVRALAQAVATRASGALVLGPEAALRRIVLHDGDIATAASGAADETLVAFLAARGDLERDVAGRLTGKLPPFGRHAGAALIAHGHLSQDDLWPVLRAHAEWIIGRALATEEGTCELEREPPGRLKAEPNVFGGATGAEVVIEAVRRVVPPEVALRRIGGRSARLAEGPRQPLLAECALRPEEEDLLRTAAGRTAGELCDGRPPEIADVLYALVSLGVLEALAPTAPREGAPPGHDPLDEEAIRQRVRARLALVEDGDYFSLLGIPKVATGYEIRRAYLDLRRTFEPARVLTAATADLADDVHLVLEVLDEAYDILRDPHRRERYRKAIEAGPP